MEAKSDKRLRIGGWLLSFPILLCLTAGAARSEGLYTRTDELLCGDTKVQAFTTCTEETDPHIPICTEQHFLFINEQAGTSVKVRASGRRTIAEPIKPRGTMMILDGLAWEWACVKGKAGLYVIIDYGTEGNCETCEWAEVFDLKGRKVLTDKSDKASRTARERERFSKKYDSLGLPNPWPFDAFTPIKLLKKDK